MDLHYQWNAKICESRGLHEFYLKPSFCIKVAHFTDLHAFEMLMRFFFRLKWLTDV